MKKILANLKLYEGNSKRKTPFVDGYRPLFGVRGNGLTSGMITLLDREKFFPGDEGTVEIKFLHADITVRDKILFYEAVEPLGECEVLQILDVDAAY